MTRPREHGPRLWTVFMLLHEDWDLDNEDEDAAMHSDLETWSSDALEEGLDQWHQAFDGATEEALERIVDDLNTTYDPVARFGSSRGWAEWIRRHLETELADRATGRRPEPAP